MVCVRKQAILRAALAATGASKNQTPRTHSFAQAGAYPVRPVVVLVHSLERTSSQPRNSARNKATFSAAVSGAVGVGGLRRRGAVSEERR